MAVLPVVLSEWTAVLFVHLTTTWPGYDLFRLTFLILHSHCPAEAKPAIHYETCSTTSLPAMCVTSHTT